MASRDGYYARCVIGSIALVIVFMTVVVTLVDAIKTHH